MGTPEVDAVSLNEPNVYRRGGGRRRGKGINIKYDLISLSLNL